MPKKISLVEKYKLKFIISLLTVMLLLVGAVVQMEKHYVSETEAAQSLQAFDQKVNADIRLVKLQILQLRYDNLVKQWYNIKSILRVEPDNTYLREELNNINVEKLLTKEKINKILENNK